jgi:hypothetical protein
MSKKKQQSRAVKAQEARRTRAIVAASAVGAVIAGVGAAFGMGWLDRFLPAGDGEHDAPEGLRPATGPGPTLSATRGEMANQTGTSNG